MFNTMRQNNRKIEDIYFELFSKYRRNCFEFRNDIFSKYMYRNSIQYSIKLVIFTNFDMFENFDTICMSLD